MIDIRDALGARMLYCNGLFTVRPYSVGASILPRDEEALSRRVLAMLPGTMGLGADLMGELASSNEGSTPAPLDFKASVQDLKRFLLATFPRHHRDEIAAAIASRYDFGVHVTFRPDVTIHETSIRWRFDNNVPCFEFFAGLEGGLLVLVVERWVDMMKFFKAMCVHPFEGEVVLSMNDEGIDEEIAFCADSRKYTLIPDPIFVGTEGYMWHSIEIRENFVKWEDRIGKAVWRGGTTGQAVDAFSLPRVKLCQTSQREPRFVDACLTGVFDRSAEEEQKIYKENLVGERLSWQEIASFKYQIDIDGHTNSWPGLLTKLHTGGLVLKVESPRGYRQWYYERLVPWMNFIPIKSDLSDLIDIIQYLEANKTTAAAIARAGYDLALSMTVDEEISRAIPLVHAVANEKQYRMGAHRVLSQ